ncbi:MAG: hypothetical protein ABL871_18390 [Terricaulis sp.]
MASIALLLAVVPACTERATSSTDDVRLSSENALVLISLTLYLPPEITEARLPDPQVLATYTQALTDAANETLAARPPHIGTSGTLIVVVKPGSRSRAWVVTGGEGLPHEMVSAAESALQAVPAPSVSGPIMLGIMFDAWGGGTPPANMPYPLPQEWIEALPPEGGQIDDALIMRVWPD